jgi:HD domain.
MSQIEKVRDCAFERLDADTGDLPDHAHCHSKQHTKGVYEGARYLAEQEGVSSEGMKLLETAALLHDVGHVESFDTHEEVGSRIAGQILPELGYSDDEVEEVQEIIMSTKVDLAGEGQLHVNPPQDILQETICDADLDNLGREDFYERSEELRRELAGKGIELSREEHYSNTRDLMQRHH